MRDSGVERSSKESIFSKLKKGAVAVSRLGVDVQPRVKLEDMDDATIINKVNEWRGLPRVRSLEDSPLTAADVLMSMGYISEDPHDSFPQQRDRVKSVLRILEHEGVLEQREQETDRYGESTAYVIVDKPKLEELSKNPPEA